MFGSKTGEANEQLAAVCHCGDTRIELPAPPQQLTECNCTFCFKRGALWIYCAPGEVVIADTNSVGYTSDPDLYTHYHCGVCGCTTYSRVACTWTENGPDFSRPRVSINARLLENFDIESLPVTRLDGRNAW